MFFSVVFVVIRHLSSVSMFMTELVLWNLLQVYLAALRWNISSLLMLDLVRGSQTQLRHLLISKRYCYILSAFEYACIQNMRMLIDITKAKVTITK